MSLQNSAQDKQFALSTKSNTGRQAKTKAFYVRDRPAEKQLSRQRNFLTRLFGTGRARENAAPARLRTRHTPTTPQLPTPASRHAMAKPAVPANQTYAVSEFAGTRPFLVQGKSQKALNQRPRPLTIDEVRELLNKNK